MALRVDLTGWNQAIKAEHPKAAVLHEAEVEGRPASPLDRGLWARLRRTIQGHTLCFRKRAKTLASRMNERTRQLLRVPPRVDEWHTAICEVRSIARSDRRNGVGTADGLDLQISKIN